MAEPVICIRDLYKAFGPKKILRGVDLDVLAAENVVILGRSGTGKSVLIKLLVGLLFPDGGSIEVFGQQVVGLRDKDLDKIRIRIGFSFQSSALYDSMSVNENLEFPLTMNERGISMAKVNERVKSALAAVGLAGVGHQMPSELSGGMRKRVGIARALMLRPEVMLYDEPTAGLDPDTAGEINALIREVQSTYQTTSIIITHDLTCAKFVGDRIAMLIDGKLTEPAPFDELFSTDDPRIRAFYDYNFVEGGP